MRNIDDTGIVGVHEGLRLVGGNLLDEPGIWADDSLGPALPDLLEDFHEHLEKHRAASRLEPEFKVGVSGEEVVEWFHISLQVVGAEDGLLELLVEEESQGDVEGLELVLHELVVHEGDSCGGEVDLAFAGVLAHSGDLDFALHALPVQHEHLSFHSEWDACLREWGIECHLK